MLSKSVFLQNQNQMILSVKISVKNQMILSAKSNYTYVLIIVFFDFVGNFNPVKMTFKYKFGEF